MALGSLPSRLSERLEVEERIYKRDDAALVRIGARLAGDGWHECVIAAVVGLLAVKHSAEDPEADEPNECVDEQIAREGESDPEFGPALEESAIRIERSDQMRPWPDQRSLNASLPRVVSEMDFRFDQENRGSDSQNNGPEKFGSKHVGPQN